MHGTERKLPAPQAAGAAISRRQRRAKRTRSPVLHLVMPGLEVAQAEPRPRETVTAFLRRTGWARRDRVYGWQFRKGLPTVLEINGEAVLRKSWSRRRIAANDNVRFVSYPLGGGGGGAKQVIGLVALIAVAAFATVVTGGAAAGLLGAAFAAGTFGAAALGAAIAVGGSLLVNALVMPKAGATNTPDATQDQIYSVQAQGNTARLGQPLPVWYGRLKAYPEFAATPWGEFVGNDQYLNVLLSPTMGSMAYEALYLDDTVFWTPGGGISASFPGAQVAFYEPGETVTLFPTNVDQSAEVSGQQLPDGGGDEGGQYDAGFGPLTYGAALGPFVSNPAGTQTQAIAIDIVFPAGCFTVNQDNNNYGYSRCTLKAEYAPCDDAGIQTGPFSTLFEVTKQFNSNSPVRDTMKVDVAPGRYLVRFSRMGINSQSKFGVDTVIWAGLRSFLKGSNSFPDVSTVAIRLKASQSTQGSYKFGVLGTRKLLVWTGSMFELQATRSNAWAFLDAATNSQYGSGLSIAKADFNAVVNHAAGCASRGDTFDYRFATAIAVPEALDKILTASRARHFWLGDTVSIVRDEWRDVPTMLLTDREIVRDSTQVGFTMLGDEDPDAVIVEYIDEEIWLPAQVQYPPNGDGFVAANAETKRVDGIVNREQAFRECAFYYLQSIYRRENVQIGVEYEGRAITFGQVLRVQSELPQNYGYGGAVVDVVGRTLTLDPAPAWDTGPFYIRLRQPNGQSFGPVLCTEGVDPSLTVLNATSLSAAETAQATTLSAVLAREDGGEYPSFELGTGVSESKLCVVLGGVPNGELCTLSLVVDDERVHTTDLGSPPLLPSPQFPSDSKVPLIVGINANFGQGIAEPKLSASWFPSAGAEFYVADISYDAGETWAQVYEGADNRFDQVVTLAALRVRVQAVTPGKLRGPYATADVAAPTITIANNTVALESLIEGIKYQITTLQDSLRDEVKEALSTIASVASDIAARAPLDKQELRSQLSARSDAAFAEIARVDLVAVTIEAAYASFATTATATWGSTTAFVENSATAIATLDDYAAAQYAVTLNVNGYASGFNLLNGGPGFSTFTIVADKFQIQLPGYNGDAPKAVFTVGTVNGVAAVGINGANMYLDGTIFARMIAAGQITAVLLAADSVTAANGAIQNLSVQSLKLADFAVTVPVAQTLASNLFGGGLKNYFSFNVTVDTTGLSGKTIPLSVFLNAKWANGGPATETGTFELIVNGTILDSYSVSVGSGGFAFILSSVSPNFTGTGGVVTIPVVARFTAGVNTAITAGSTISAQAAKR
ncbi:host specificity factor TipJ family phage tail protein [Bradyrhizobium sp. Arg816]|uniref:host specificity factor TipJ family phage tail protein n=1 Tax=Bradyrhizobium sp. Arg816 TaxID=2998491 RepID=UPI00249F05EC|nr:host specificity factor TipJ family phage tail protein [Bradyrhizobium sp. Arg816]MDI3559562.1 host specificity factor TipJ family phage tail protein [Bradyrhizobium sp. Arg816]